VSSWPMVALKWSLTASKVTAVTSLKSPTKVKPTLISRAPPSTSPKDRHRVTEPKDLLQETRVTVRDRLLPANLQDLPDMEPRILLQETRVTVRDQLLPANLQDLPDMEPRNLLQQTRVTVRDQVPPNQDLRQETPVTAKDQALVIQDLRAMELRDLRLETPVPFRDQAPANQDQDPPVSYRDRVTAYLQHLS